MPSNYSAKRKQNLVPHYYDRHSRNFGFIDQRAISGAVISRARDEAFKRLAQTQSWRDQPLVRVVRHG